MKIVKITGHEVLREEDYVRVADGNLLQLKDNPQLCLFFIGQHPEEFPTDEFFREEAAEVSVAFEGDHTLWIGVDFDHTLATHQWPTPLSFTGEPIPEMVSRVKTWIAEGKQVKILTARMAAIGKRDMVTHQLVTRRMVEEPIQAWCLKHLGVVLEITASKDFAMVELWDDRAVQVEADTGRRVDLADSLQRRLGEWQDQTFPNATAESCYAHLVDEVRELGENLEDATEMADCVMLLMCLASKQGVNLQEAVERKFEINRKRTWGPVNAHGFQEHVPEDAA